MANSERNVEDIKKLVVHTLETNGVLGQIRAELRANVYKVIDEDETHNPTKRPPAKLMNSPMGSLMAEIVAEFFEFYEFRHSLSVFMPESNLGRNERRSRDQVALDAGLDPRTARAELSILEQLVGLATAPAEGLRKGGDCRGDDWHSSASSTTASSPPPAAPASAPLRGEVVARSVPHVDSFASQNSTMPAPLAQVAPPVAPPVALPVALPVAPLAPPEATPPPGPAITSTSPSSAIVSTKGASAGLGGNIIAKREAVIEAPATATRGGEEQEEANGIARKPSDEHVAQEVSANRRKQRGKLLPSISGPKAASPSGLGQLPPLKGTMSPASLSGASDRGGPEEVSLSESSVGVSRESCEEVRDEVLRLDRRLARFPGRPATGAGGYPAVSAVTPTAPVMGGAGATAPSGTSFLGSGLRDFNSSILSDSGEKALEVAANDASAVSAVSAGSQMSASLHGAARSLPRSTNSSPANSANVGESPLRSPSPPSLQSPGASPHGHTAESFASHASSASPAAAGSPHSSGSPNQSLGAQSAQSQSISEEVMQEGSISIDGSSGDDDGDLDLALTGAGRSIAPAKGLPPIQRQPVFPSSGPMQAVVAEDDGDDDHYNSDSHESYQSSEAALSTGEVEEVVDDF